MKLEDQQHRYVGKRVRGREGSLGVVTKISAAWVYVCFGEPGTKSQACHHSSLTLLDTGETLAR